MLSVLLLPVGDGEDDIDRNCLLDWAPSGANKKLPPGLGPGSFLKKLQWGPVFLCQIEYGGEAPLLPAGPMLISSDSEISA